MEPSRNGVLKTELQTSITKLEEVWEGEARMVMDGWMVDFLLVTKIGNRNNICLTKIWGCKKYQCGTDINYVDIPHSRTHANIIWCC